ncbi:hypothetical protein QYM36_002388 [Artemia franciscana]|uniref:Uncharacterized protein n=1 Tax=Artemia franciscana TaxID=6661 RepID=A0AA88I9P6_ARTSF|nr:hypothetical protein QYM36_002388 [Artemia franciscana]
MRKSPHEIGDDRVLCTKIYAEDTLKDGFYDNPQSVIDSIQLHDLICIAVDLKAKVGRERSYCLGVMGQHGVGTITKNGARLFSFTKGNDLLISGELFQHKDINTYAWTSRNERAGFEAPSRIGALIERGRLLQNIVSLWKIGVEKHMGSSHHKTEFKSQDTAKTTHGINSNEVKIAEAKITNFLVENDSLLSVGDNLLPLLKSLILNHVLEKVTLGKQKATNENSHEAWSSLVETLKSIPLSFMMEVTTATCVKKQLSIAVLWCGRTLAIQVDILDLIECPDGRAKTLFSLMESNLKNKGSLL